MRFVPGFCQLVLFVAPTGGEEITPVTIPLSFYFVVSFFMAVAVILPFLPAYLLPSFPAVCEGLLTSISSWLELTNKLLLSCAQFCEVFTFAILLVSVFVYCFPR